MKEVGSTELRQDPITGNWVIIAAGRGARPRDVGEPIAAPPDAVDCPFCPGHEDETPPEVWRLNGPDGDWRIRVVPNLYSVLSEDGDADVQVSPEGFRTMPGRGSHEVVIESPEHNSDLAQFGVDHVRDVLTAYRARYCALRERGAELIVIFRNHGPRAGTSLMHPHSQIVAAPLVPEDERGRLQRAISHYEETGRSLHLDLLEREFRDGRRILLANDRFVAFHPFASAWPYEAWIMPRAPQPSFGAIADEDIDTLAPLLRAVLAGLRRGVDDPDYNYMIHSTPAIYADREYLTWYLQIAPRLTTPAGFELGSGIRVNPTVPEEAASLLREAIAEGS